MNLTFAKLPLIPFGREGEGGTKEIMEDTEEDPKVVEDEAHPQSSHRQRNHLLRFLLFSSAEEFWTGPPHAGAIGAAGNNVGGTGVSSLFTGTGTPM